jgi:hypothetical protein
LPASAKLRMMRAMELKKAFLMGFVLAFAAAAALAIFVVLFGKWGQFELQVLLTTASIGVYSLIALCCSTIYQDEKWKWLAGLGIATCGIGLAFAVLTNWELIKPELENLLKLRFFFLSVAMAIAATSLMIRVAARATAVSISKGVTICLIWITTGLVNLLLFERTHVARADEMLLKLLAVSGILGLLGIIATPILKKIATGNGSSS